MKLRSAIGLRWLAATLSCLTLLCGESLPAQAQDSAPPAADSAEADAASKEEARAKYSEGLAHVRSAQWGEALSSFLQSRELHRHAMTTYNVAACERALGHYTRAQEWFNRALAEHAEGQGLTPPLLSEAEAYLGELDRLLVRIRVKLVTRAVSLTVDGRPLATRGVLEGKPVLVGGLLPPGPGMLPPADEFVLLLDPGLHIITASSRGYKSALINETFAPGHRGELTLELEVVPATLRVSASEPGAQVKVGNKAEGAAPVDVLRPAGMYRVEVTKDGFLPYTATVRVRAGEEATLRASLVKEVIPITSRWWFWTAAGVLVAGAATTTYFAVQGQDQAERPPLNGGSLDWAAELP